MGDAIVGGLIGGAVPALIALISVAFGVGKMASSIEHLRQGMEDFREEVGELRGDLRSLHDAIFELAQRVAKLEVGYS